MKNACFSIKTYLKYFDITKENREPDISEQTSKLPITLRLFSIQVSGICENVSFPDPGIASSCPEARYKMIRERGNFSIAGQMRKKRKKKKEKANQVKHSQRHHS